MKFLQHLVLAALLFSLLAGCARSSQANDNPPPPVVTEEPSYAIA